MMVESDVRQKKTLIRGASVTSPDRRAPACDVGNRSTIGDRREHARDIPRPERLASGPRRRRPIAMIPVVPATRSPHDVLDSVLPDGAPLVVDVGCGDGSLVRHLARRGARAVGVEVGAEPLARARAHVPVGDERYERAGAQALPLDDGTADAVLFMNSLHHVPREAMDAALAEAARVLRPGGLLYVQEPLAEGPYFELLRPVDDETAVRAAAHVAIGRAGRHGLAHEREIRFDNDVVHGGFGSFRDRVVLADAARAAAFAGVEDDLRERFERTAERVADGYRFEQPMRVDVLRKAG
jgi:SAM-dependent methyltransferase